MKKTIRLVALSLATMVAAFVVVGTIAPKQIQIRSTVRIQAPKEAVFPQINNFQNFPSWSPFLETDPEQVYYITGTDGAVGAQYHWQGNKEETAGYQELQALSEDSIQINCFMSKPMTTTSSFHYRLSTSGDCTTVTQDFSMNLPFPMNALAPIFGIKEKIAQTNERGLNNLKCLIEKNEYSQR
jgi:hypothetical protein